MPVFTIEIDTDAKTCKKMVNGVEVHFDTMSLSQYSYPHDDGETMVYEYGVNIAKRSGNERVSQFFSWTEREGSCSDLEHSRIESCASAETKDMIQKKRYYLFDQYKQEGGKNYKKDKDK